MQIYERPIFYPYVCIRCGVNGPPREWFVDLNFSIDHYFNTDNHAVYLCNECYMNTTQDISKLIQSFRKEHEKWESDEEPTYNWLERNNDVRESESSGSDSGIDESESFDAAASRSADRNDQDPESDNPEPESTDSGDADSTDDSGSDGSGESGLSGIAFGTQ